MDFPPDEDDDAVVGVADAVVDAVVEVVEAAVAAVRIELRCGWMRSSCSVKLKSGGNSLPLGSRVEASLSSSKKLWAQASKGVMRELGVYSSNLPTSSIASGGVRGRKTLVHGCAVI